MSRHMACKSCRDRKVRCNGEIECDNCKRTGEVCVYAPTQRPTKSELMQTIEALQARLGIWITPGEKAEAFVAGQNLATQSNAYMSPTSEPINGENHGFEFQVPSFSVGSIVGQDSIQASQHLVDGSQIPETPDVILYDLSSNRPSPAMPSSHSMPRYSISSMAGMPTDSSGSVQSRPNTASVLSRMPSLREIRAMNTASSPTATPRVWPPCEFDREQDYSAFHSSLVKFLAVVSKTQSEIAGITSAVAEYLSWMRREPTMASSGALKQNYSIVLETLEARVREVRDLAERNHYVAWEQFMTSTMEIEGLGDKAKQIEEEMRKHEAEVATLFKEDYDICASLPEQCRRINR
ncbi:hypothetical protein F5B19DRAFT_495761 [Rostrohypoxylon terebratum]|nr:hypothetical protein F5B19DRAFT_495761 [Rostrohypoxylon terebratum]